MPLSTPPERHLPQVIEQSFPGTIIIVDKQGTIIYHRNNGLDTGLPSESFLGSSIYLWTENEIFSRSPTVRALESKKREIDYVGGKSKTPIVTLSVPTLDEHGEIDVVTAYSLPVDLIYESMQRVEYEKAVANSKVRYLQMAHSDAAASIVAENEIMKETYSRLGLIAGLDCSVLLVGESGTGKEVMARYIHNHSNRADETFVPINCATIPAELFEAELFGYEKGSFTGASKEGKMGLFELADKGTLFLDEIAEMPLSLQAKLLRVLESGEFKRIGGLKTLKTSARIISATNRDLSAMVSENKFREDLYYRISVVPVNILPLRNRKEDIVPLAELFLERFNKKYRTQKRFFPSTLTQFQQYRWPGNVRELRNVVERMYAISQTDYLMYTDANLSNDPEPIVPERKAQNIPAVTSAKPYKETMQDLEAEYIRQVLEETEGNVALAAARMQLSRAGLYKKISALKQAKKLP